MQRLSIRQVMFLLLLVPVVSAAVSFYQILPQSIGEMVRSKTFQSGTGVIAAAANLVHELQRERGSSAGLVSATENRGEHRNRVMNQQTASDTALETFTKQYQQAMTDAALAKRSQRLTDAVASINEDLKTMREKIFTGAASVPDIVGFYTRVINELMDGIDVLANGNNADMVTAKREALRSVLVVKEFAGLERATGNALLSAQRADEALGQRFAGLVALQKHFLGELRRSLELAELDQLMRTMSNSVIQEHEVAQSDILAKLRARDTGFQLKSAEWWALTTKRIDELKKLEETLVASLTDASADLGSKAAINALRTIGIQIVAVLGAILVIFAIGRSISRPIVRASIALERSLGGETDIEAPPPMSDRSEIGKISNAVGRFIAANAEREQLIAERERLNREMAAARKGAMAQMESEFGRATSDLTATLASSTSTLRSKSEAMLVTISAVRQSQDEAQAAASDTAQTVGEVTRLSDELSRSIAEIAEQSQRTAELTREVQGRADRSREAASAFEEVANAIGSITGLINAIAAQTNLLALNATIEAARAGEAGRGFAVVAGEVKGLAARTVDATSTIEHKVAELKSIAKDAAEQSTALSGDVGTIQGLNAAIAAAVHEQHMTSESFSEQLRQMTSGIAAVVEQISMIAELGNNAVTAATSVETVSGDMESVTRTIAETLPQIIADTSRRLAG
jgi:methyl-accepting chemotaxis protein